MSLSDFYHVFNLQKFKDAVHTEMTFRGIEIQDVMQKASFLLFELVPLLEFL